MKQLKGTLAGHNIGIMYWIHFFGAISFLAPVLTLFYTERGLTASQILIVLMFWSGAVLIGEVPTGIFADRFGAKVSFLTGTILKMISLVILLFAYEPWMFFLYSFVNGLSVTFFSGADEALIYDSLKESGHENQMDQAMGHIQAAGFISMIFAVLFGAYFAKDLQNEQFILLIIMGLLFYLVELFLVLKVKQPTQLTSYRENPFTQVKSGMKVIKDAPQLLMMFLNVSLVFIPAGVVYEYFDQPLMLEAGLPVYLIGIMYAIASLIGYVASNSIGWLTRTFSRILLMNITGALAVVGLLLSALVSHSLLVILGAFLLLRFVKAVRYPIYSQLSNDLIPSNVRATTLSLLSIIDSVLDLVVFGAISIVAISGYNNVLIGSAIIVLIGTLLPIRKVEKDIVIESAEQPSI
ncbi:MFS transporter [Bacillus pinisoli]|uniref:MFS transporter n=1 Tax=Bacillus pinisoli TaxID=2901866 RepID=UPI001FF35BDA|nr:MFS transporter [Bacillus pinisoli]